MAKNSITDAVSALNEGRWGPLAALIQDIRSKDGWRQEFKNFSEWMLYVSKTYKLSQARLWRYHSSGAFYQRLREQHRSLPNLMDIPANTISAEALELLEKLKRVAPESLVREVEARILSGDMPMKELKTTWATFKPRQTPKSDSRRDAREAASQFESTCLHALERDTRWTGLAKVSRCHVLRSIPDSSGRREFDGVALVQKNRSDEVDIHVFDIKITPERTRFQWAYPKWTGEADFCWAVSNCADPALIMSHLEPHIGVVSFVDDELTVHRKATRQTSDQTFTPFARAILLRALRV